MVNDPDKFLGDQADLLWFLAPYFADDRVEATNFLVEIIHDPESWMDACERAKLGLDAQGEIHKLLTDHKILGGNHVA